MLAAWICTASIGTLIARYFRKTWVGRTMCGKDLWFAWHRFFMVMTWGLTTVAFILIFVELGAWSSEDNPHAILGTIVTVLCFLQPIGAFFRPHPGTPKRPIFNWLHWFGGNAAHIVASKYFFLHFASLPLSYILPKPYPLPSPSPFRFLTLLQLFLFSIFLLILLSILKVSS